MHRFYLTFLILTVACLKCISQPVPVDSLLRIVSQEQRDSAYIHALSWLSQLNRGKDNDKAVFYSREILRYPNINPPQTAKANITIALIHTDRASFDSASMYFSTAEKIAENYPDNTQLWEVMYNGLGLFHKKQGNNAKALEYYEQINKLGEAAGKESLAGNQLNIANIYNRMGNRGEAIKYLFKAMPMFESLNNLKGMSYCYNNLGLLLKQQGNLNDAETYLQKSLKLKEDEGDVKGIANSCNELALLFMEKNQLKNAISYVDRTIALSQKLGSHELHATALMNKGKILRIERKYDAAAAEFQKAKLLTENLPNHYLLASLQSEMGKLYAERKQNQEAIKTLQSSIIEGRKEQ
jgi:tetratricopeptide (TPR) repeat protein